jgi:hypothetical protein
MDGNFSLWFFHPGNRIPQAPDKYPYQAGFPIFSQNNAG